MSLAIILGMVAVMLGIASILIGLYAHRKDAIRKRGKSRNSGR